MKGKGKRDNERGKDIREGNGKKEYEREKRIENITEQYLEQS